MTAQDEIESILDAAVRSDRLWYESLYKKQRRSKQSRALRRAGDPEASLSPRAVLAGVLKAELAGPTLELVRHHRSCDAAWTWIELPLDVQIRLLRELFTQAGLLDRFRWDRPHDFPVW